MRGRGSHVEALRNLHRHFTPTDLGFNSVNWTKAGTNSIDIWVQGLRMLEGFAISDDAWAVDVAVFNENGTAIVFGPTLLFSDVGRSGGQVDPDPFLFGPIQYGFADRIRFRGRGLLATTANSTLRVFGRS